MPTAVKLFAALFFAAVAWYAAELVTKYLEEGTPIGRFREIMAGFGVWMGWVIMGRRSGRAFQFSLGAGLTTSAAIVLWGLLAFSFYTMIVRSTRFAYDGPFHALEDMVLLIGEYLVTLAKPDVIGVLVVGGLIGGALSHVVKRTWS